MAIVRFPQNFCKSICASIAHFWWRSKGKNRGIHWKTWAKLTKSKLDRGFGFKDFTDMNSTLLAKQAWRVINNPNTLWVKVLKSIYYSEDNFLTAKRRRNDSWVWVSLLHGRDEILRSARWAVGNGENISVQNDVWLASGQKIEQHLASDINKVKDLMEMTNRCWDLSKIKDNFSPEIAIKISPNAYCLECGGRYYLVASF